MSLMDNLVRLHRVDAQVRALQGRLAAAQRYLTGQESKIAGIDEQYAEIDQRRRQTEALQGNDELETTTLDERIEKLRDELNSASTNKQYNALLSELDTIKQLRVASEEKTLGHMEAIETMVGELAELNEQKAEREKVREVARQQLAEREKDVGERLAELEAERAEAASAIPGHHLAVFNEVADIYDGESMAAVEEINRRHREYACDACHMTVPFEHISVLANGDDVLKRCTACSRILYMQGELKGELVKD